MHSRRRASLRPLLARCAMVGRGLPRELAVSVLIALSFDTPWSLRDLVRPVSAADAPISPSGDSRYGGREPRPRDGLSLLWCSRARRPPRSRSRLSSLSRACYELFREPVDFGGEVGDTSVLDATWRA